MELFDTLPARGPSEMTKSAFSAHIGVSKSRISQLIRDGLPVLPNGRIPVEAAELGIRPMSAILRNLPAKLLTNLPR